jgi:hypothetical protein
MLPETAGTLKYFASPALAKPGITHAFSCRCGAPLESMRRLSGRVIEAFNLSALLMARQVHGTEVLSYDGDMASLDEYWKRPFDAIITSTEKLAIGVRTADCAPVLLAAPGKAVAAVHGGWKGILAGIIGKTVAKMLDSYQIDPAGIVAAIGPHIRSCCYEVGPDVAGLYAERFGEAVLKPGKSSRPRLDLEAAVRLNLQNAGLECENIHAVQLCTSCLPEWFFSYRRDGRPTGRQVNFIYIG